jgi:hypothetical protein
MDGLGAEPVDVTEELGLGRVMVYLRDASSGTQWFASTKAHLASPGRAGDRTAIDIPTTFDVTASIDPRRIAGGHSLRPGVWDAWMSVSFLGLDRRGRLGPVMRVEADGPAKLISLAGGTRSTVARLDSTGLHLDVASDTGAKGAPGGHPIPPSDDPMALSTKIRWSAMDRALRVYGRLPSGVQRVARTIYRPLPRR